MIRPPSFHSGRPAPGFAEFSIKFLPCRYSRSQGKRKKTGAHCRNAGESGLGSQGVLSGKAWEFVRAHSNQSAPSTGASRRPHPTLVPHNRCVKGQIVFVFAVPMSGWIHRNDRKPWVNFCCFQGRMNSSKVSGSYDVQ